MSDEPPGDPQLQQQKDSGENHRRLQKFQMSLKKSSFPTFPKCRRRQFKMLIRWLRRPKQCVFHGWSNLIALLDFHGPILYQARYIVGQKINSVNNKNPPSNRSYSGVM